MIQTEYAMSVPMIVRRRDNSIAQRSFLFALTVTSATTHKVYTRLYSLALNLFLKKFSTFENKVFPSTEYLKYFPYFYY